MLRAFATALIALLFATPALAGPIVVWLESEVPEGKLVRKVEAQLGEDAKHLAHPDLAFAPQPFVDADHQLYDGLRTKVLDAKGRWTQWDVEGAIALELQAQFDAITAIRDDRHVEWLVEARLVQGAAAHNAFSPSDFQDSQAAEAFRTVVPGAKVNKPWLQALALDPDRPYMASDFVDGATFEFFQELQTRVRELPPGYLDLSDLPRGSTVVVDGVEVAAGTSELPLTVGDHFVHVLLDGVVSGRQIVFVDAGLSTEVPLPISQIELSKAHELLARGSTVGFPEDVRAGVLALGEYHDGDLYVAAVVDGKVELRPFDREVKKPKRRVVTVVGNGEIGGGVLVSRLFDDAGDKAVTAPIANGTLGVEIGIYNAVILGGFDLAFAPSQTITHGNKDEDDNVSTSVYAQPWGGLGGYVIRPNDTHATLLLALTYGWNAPAHMALGFRTTLGVPVDDEGTWFRLTVGGSTAAHTRQDWQDAGIDESLHVLFLRVGFGTRF